ncbi:MAG: RecQ family ATP-dependent DNA helicase [Chloroflexota bacterium]|nr:RecQ family ATP-dependent DNA helicase [Chloroflexota bacterium]
MQCSQCDTDWPAGAPNCPGCGAFADEPPPLLDLDAPPVSEAVDATTAPARARAEAPPLQGRLETGSRAARSPAPAAELPRSVERYRELLQERFGYPDFRPGQAEVLERLADCDVLGVMPTGGGKSLCYVLPALEVGRALVVSPLIALMQDQVEALQGAGVAADYINSTLSAREQNRRFVDFTEGRTALLYVAPERVANPRFVAGLQRAGVRLLVVDEAHCISEWGHDFRPDYLALGVARAQLGEPRTLALTATADATVRRDILVRLGIAGASEVVTSFDRPNLRFAAQQMDAAGDRLDWLVRYTRARNGQRGIPASQGAQSGIVYARTRRNVEETAEALQAAGVRAEAYHAGMPGPLRASRQRRFTTGETPVIVATNAFGLGIDKPDVRFVVHLGMPGRLESYYQEAGRAGRDGEPAECTLLYARRDVGLQRRFIAQAHPDDEQVRRAWHRLVELQRFAPDRPLAPADAADAGGGEGWPVTLTALRASELVEPGALRLTTLDAHAPIDTRPIEERRRHAESRLSQMVEYAETTGCRRALVLRYFGEEPGAADCGGCDNCTQTTRREAPAYPGELFDAILDLRSRIAYDTGRPPYTVFEERTAREIATYRPHDDAALLATWGMGETRVRWFGADLLALVRDWESEHADAPAPPHRPEPKAASRRRRAEADETGPEVAFDDPLYERLREWRRDRARSEGVPAYTFFTDRSARELASRRPDSREALLGVWGLGDARVEAFGDDLLALIRDHCGKDAETPGDGAQMPLAAVAPGGHA